MGKDFDRCGFEGLRLLGFPWGDLTLALKWSTDFCFVNKHFLFPSLLLLLPLLKKKKIKITPDSLPAGAFKPLCLCRVLFPFFFFYIIFILASWKPASMQLGWNPTRTMTGGLLPPGPHFAHSWQGKSIFSWFIYQANERVMSPQLEGLDGPKTASVCSKEQTSSSSLSAKNSHCLKMTCCI